MDSIRLGSACFPALLAEISHPPKVLWIRGDPSICNRTVVAVVGARRASREGVAAAEAIAGDLARAGIVIASGLARGIDAAAHAGALDAGGTTIAVLGTGIDCVYPPENEALFERIARSGLLMTEFPPGEPPYPGNFPKRNRIISGLSRAVLVVEAAEKSGSLITARLAAEQGRDVMAMPGLTAGGRNRGAHALLKDGAKLVESAVDILQELGIGCPGGVSRETPQAVEFTVDDIAGELKIPAGDALARLLEWELTGQIRRIGSGRFIRAQMTQGRR
ncbi:MAG: DNA-processing protein DprA [Vicinamibacterales bacterium]